MAQIKPWIDDTETSFLDWYELCVYFLFAIVVVSVIWLMVALCGSLPTKSPKSIERPLSHETSID